MRRAIQADDVARLARSTERLLRLVKEIGERTADIGGGGPAEPGSDAEAGSRCRPGDANAALLQAASDAAKAHRAQPDFGAPALFHNPTWLLMLELFTAHKQGVDVPVTNACLTLGGSQTTALRCLLDLERRGLLQSRQDERDGRRRLIHLSPTAERQLESYLEEACGNSDQRQGQGMRLAVRLTRHEVSGESSSHTSLVNRSSDSSNVVQTSLGPNVILQ